MFGLISVSFGLSGLVCVSLSCLFVRLTGYKEPQCLKSVSGCLYMCMCVSLCGKERTIDIKRENIITIIYTPQIERGRLSDRELRTDRQTGEAAVRCYGNRDRRTRRRMGWESGARAVAGTGGGRSGSEERGMRDSGGARAQVMLGDKLAHPIRLYNYQSRGRV